MSKNSCWLSTLALYKMMKASSSKSTSLGLHKAIHMSSMVGNGTYNVLLCDRYGREIDKRYPVL